jgi:hypothetical protein
VAIAPNTQEALAIEIRRIYEDAEIELMKMIAKRLVSGSGDVAEWQKEKMNQLAPLIRDATKIMGKTNRRIPKAIEKIIELAYLAGDESAVDDLTEALNAIKEGEPIPESIQMALFPDDPDPKIDIDATITAVSGINQEAIIALAGATTETLTDTAVPIVRQIDDIYRRVVTRTVGSVLTGVETRREATQRILNDFAKSGITYFDGKRHWNIASYSEMATRSAIGQASVQGHINKMTRMGFDLVQVSDHKEECELCRPWEGKVLSVDGNDPKYKSLAQATRAGLFHPNCGHRLNTYFEGLTTPLTKTRDPGGYEDRKKQRYIERQIRQWKRRQALAGDPQSRQLADNKVKQWNETMKDFIEETGRRRKHEREQNVRAR